MEAHDGSGWWGGWSRIVGKSEDSVVGVRGRELQGRGYPCSGDRTQYSDEQLLNQYGSNHLKSQHSFCSREIQIRPPVRTAEHADY